jgi:transcriptional regulator with XRE-family HTH domain
MTNTNKLRARMIEKGLNQTDIAHLLKKTVPTANYKINNKKPFTADEMFILCEALEIDNPKEYFFANNVEK